MGDAWKLFQVGGHHVPHSVFQLGVTMYHTVYSSWGSPCTTQCIPVGGHHVPHSVFQLGVTMYHTVYLITELSKTVYTLI